MEFPVLLKEPNKEYSIGVDISRENSSEKRFTFCIMAKGKNDSIGTIVALKHFLFTTDMEYTQYVNSLREFYDCPILIDK